MASGSDTSSSEGELPVANKATRPFTPGALSDSAAGWLRVLTVTPVWESVADSSVLILDLSPEIGGNNTAGSSP